MEQFFILNFTTKIFSPGNRSMLIETAKFLDRYQKTNLGLNENGFFSDFTTKEDIKEFKKHLKMIGFVPYEIHSLKESYN
jgi:hypothetical protein